MNKRTFLLCCTLISLPFARALFSVEIGIVTFNIYSLAIIGLFAAALIQEIFTPAKYTFTLVDLFILLFSLIFALNTVLAENLIRSGHMAYRAVFLPVITYIVIRSFVTDDRNYRHVLLATVIGMATYCLAGLLYSGITFQRTFILGQNPIGAATLAVFPLIVLIFTGRCRRKQWFLLCFASLLLLLLTYSRVYYLAVIASPLFFWLIRKGQGFKLFASIFAASLIVALLLASNPEPYRAKFIRPEERQSMLRIITPDLYRKALAGRARQYGESMELFRESPLIGSGLQRGSENVTVHNFHMEWLAYGGIIGYFLGAGIFFSLFISQNMLGREDRYTAVQLCLLVIILINCISNGIMHGLMPYLVFILLGLAESRRLFLARDTGD